MIVESDAGSVTEFIGYRIHGSGLMLGRSTENIPFITISRMMCMFYYLFYTGGKGRHCGANQLPLSRMMCMFYYLFYTAGKGRHCGANQLPLSSGRFENFWCLSPCPC
jgi:hypothetical protein